MGQKLLQGVNKAAKQFLLLESPHLLKKHTCINLKQKQNSTFSHISNIKSCFIFCAHLCFLEFTHHCKAWVANIP